MRYGRLLGYGVVVLLALAAAGCGGSSSGGGSTTPPPTHVTVAISPVSSTVGYGGTQQFTATVTGSTNAAVTWSVTSASSSSSTQIGTINSSSGLYTAPAATSAPLEPNDQIVTVTAGSPAQNVNISVPPLNTTTSVTVTATSQADTSKSASVTVTLSGLSIVAVGQCVLDTTNPGTLNCSAGSTGTEVSQSQSIGQIIYLFVAGYGILPGTTYTISGSDVTILPQPASLNFRTTPDGTPAVFFQITVSPTAVLGPRNLVVRNSGNELTSFVGAVEITP